MDLIFYDLEISKTIEEAGGWECYDNMGIGSAVAYSSNNSRYFLYLHDDSREKLVKLLNGNKVVTYNGINFDSKLILGADRIIESTPNGVGIIVSNKDRSVRWVEFDIYLQILKAQHGIYDAINAIKKYPKSAKGGLKLGGVASATISAEYDKTGDAEDAPLLYKAGDYGSLLEYNLQDTALTKRLYEFIIEHNYVNDAFGNRINLNLNLKKNGE